MLLENKAKVQKYLEQLPDKYLNELIEYLHFLQFKSKSKVSDKSSMLLSEKSLAKEWLTNEEDEAWKDL